jgi:hypothetical protein
LGAAFFKRAQAVEGIFVEITQAGIDGRPAPGFQAAEAHLIENRSGGQHLRGGHAGGGQRLMTIAQDGVVEGNGFHEGKLAIVIDTVPAEFAEGAEDRDDGLAVLLALAVFDGGGAAEAVVGPRC